MVFPRELLFFFSALGAFNGLLLSAYFLFFAKRKHLSNYFLGLLLLVLSLRIGKSVFLFFNHELAKIYLQIGLSSCFFIGPFLYFFIKSATGPINQFPEKWKIGIAILFAGILIVGILFPYATHLQLWGYFAKIIYTEWLIFIVASGFALKGIWKKIATHSIKNLKPFEKWMLIVFFVNVAVFLSYWVAGFLNSWAIYISGPLIFSIILYLTVFLLVKRQKIEDVFYVDSHKYVNKKIQEGKANTLFQLLEKQMLEKQLYKNPNLVLGDLAKEINTGSHQLSQILNDNIGKSFTTYINEYRIEEACNLMLTDNRLSLEGIGFEVGFNSKSTFFSTFKKFKNTTPAAFQKQHLNSKV
jgi:AraC-like DNA-binding protein